MSADRPFQARTTAIAPMRPADRILTLDVLRGFAVLGILAVNALAFAWPIEVVMRPASAPFAPGGLMNAGDALATWWVEVFFDDRMRALFTLLFGVSVFLVGGERDDATRGRLLRRRLFWLAAIGLVHGLGLWFGDILLLYACCGLLVMPARSWPAPRLLWIGGGITLMWALQAAADSLWTPNADSVAEAAQSTAEAARTLAAVEIGRGGGVGAWIQNARAWALVQGIGVPMSIPSVAPLMMLGLGLYKSGFLTGRSATWIYAGTMGLAAAVLAGLGWWECRELAAAANAGASGGWAGAAAAFAPLIALGYASALILMTTRGPAIVTRALAPVGRMAFTNYLTQTLIMTGLFSMPWGPRWFGEIGPTGLWPIVVGVWALQLVWSPLWLSRFEMGPLEWVWRCLTYGRRVPLLKRA